MSSNSVKSWIENTQDKSDNQKVQMHYLKKKKGSK